MSISKLTLPALHEPQISHSTVSTSSINVIAASSDLPGIQTGQLVQVQILGLQNDNSIDSSDNNGNFSYRALVNGREVVVTSESSLPEGKALTLEASVQGVAIKFTLPAGDAQAQSADPASEVQRAFQALLKQLNLSENDIKQTIANLINPSNLQLKVPPALIDQQQSGGALLHILKGLTQENRLVDAPALKDVSRLADILRSGVNNESQLAVAAREQLENLALRSASPQIKETITTLERLTEAFHKQEPQRQSIDNTATDDTFKATLEGRNLKDILTLLKNSSADVNRTNKTDVDAHEKIVSFLKSHISQVRKLESQMRTTLSTIHQESGLSLLKETLAPFITPPPPESNEITRSFQRFASRLYEDLSQLENKPHQRAELHRTLESALATLTGQFSDKTADQFNSLTADESHRITPRADLPRPVATAVKSLYAQIQTLLNSPELQNRDIETLISYLGSLKETANQANPAAKLLGNLASTIEQNIKDHFSQHGAQSSLREILENAANTLKVNFGESGVEHARATLTEQLTKLLQSQQIQLDDLQQFVDHLNRSIRDLSSSSHSQDKKLVTFIKNIIQTTGQLVKTEAPLDAQRDFLLNIQAQLLKNFPESRIPGNIQAQGGESIPIKHLIPDNLLSRKAQSALRSINAQLNNLLQLTADGTYSVTNNSKTDAEALATAAHHQTHSEMSKAPLEYLSQSSALPQWTVQEQNTIEKVLRSRGALELINFLRGMQLSELDPTFYDQQVMQFMINLIRDLEESAFKPERTTREISRKAAGRLKDLAQQATTKAGGAETSKEQIKALKTLESMLRSNEILSQMNPLLQAAGEPAMLLFPTLIQGMLSGLELSLYPPGNYLNPDDHSDKSTRKEAKSYQRLQLNFTLPSLGAVAADVKYGHEEIYLNIAVNAEKFKKFLEKRKDLLMKALQKRGFTTTQINISHENPQGLQPHWITQTPGSDSIIA